MHTEQKNLTTQEETAQVEEKPVRRPLPAPGKPLSFEEAKELTFEKYDNALRELAK